MKIKGNRYQNLPQISQAENVMQSMMFTGGGGGGTTGFGGGGIDVQSNMTSQKLSFGGGNLK